MAEIIPSIIAGNFTEVEDKIRQGDGLTGWVELDIMDGVFVPNFTWQTPDDLKILDGRAKLSAHLMMEAPETIMEDWQDVVDRIIVHFEATDDLAGIIDRQGPHCSLGLALTLDTPVTKIYDYLEQIKLVQLMSIKRVGFAGESFVEEVFAKISALKNDWPEIKIIVDGGIDRLIAVRLMQAGVDGLVVGSRIWQADDPAKALRAFQSLE